MKLKIVQSDGGGDWFSIERAEHDGRMWLEPTEYGSKLMCSSRICDADVEGNFDEMRAIATAIRERRGLTVFGRCAVACYPNQVRFWSPRNSHEEGVVSFEEAEDLAAQIEALPDFVP